MTTEVTPHATYDAARLVPAAADEPPPPPTAATVRWAPGLRVAFRFCFVFFTLVAGPFPSAARPMASAFGYLVLGITQPMPLQVTGSGDTLINYVTIALFATIAAVTTVIWSIVDRRRLAYVELHEWLRMGLRFALALILFGYGVVKIVPVQFSTPPLERLAEPLGEFSPMGLLWTFMGYSAPYTIFAGLGEAIGSLLLCFRRTATLGALLLVAVMSNVVMLNFAYDVPVKLNSSLYLAMAFFLVAPDAGRLFNVLVRNRVAPPRDLEPFGSPRRRRTARIVDRSLAVLILSEFALSLVGAWRYPPNNGTPSPLRGIYDVVSFTRTTANGTVLSNTRDLWRRVILSTTDHVTIRTARDSVLWYTVKTDPVSRTLQGLDLSVTYVRTADEVVLTGWVHGDSIHTTLRKVSDGPLRLMNRRFHWIQEFPYNW